jgi:acylphosphatase|tara:strand:+ start:122 stop:403 length:282 start_codon:yes stop_codon:yes gene_type:complete
MIAKRVFFSGRVQGVGFRYETKRIAMGYEVVGTISNLEDGRVELCVMGEELEVDDFISDIRIESNLAPHILEYAEEIIPSSELNEVRGFTIVR